MITPRFRWRYPDPTPPSPAYVAAVGEAGGSARIARVLSRRHVDAADLAGFFGEPEHDLHDPALLPDAEVVVARIARARASSERVLVFGDFDADGLTGLAVMVRALRGLGISVIPHVPNRLDDGHGLSRRAVETASAEGVGLIITVDTGSSSVAEVALARAAGIDVIITDHHRVPPDVPAALALVNAHRPDSSYPDRRLAGSGVALKIAALLRHRLAGEDVLAATEDLADLAAIGTVADVAPILGENRSIARLGLRRLAREPRPGLAALLARAGVAPADVTLETIAFAIAPRLNAAGRMGEADDAAALLLADDPDEAVALAARLEAANSTRRDVTRTAVAEAREALAADGAMDAAAILVRGAWPVGVLGLVAGRLAEEHGRPAIVAAPAGETLRASCRAPEGYDLGAALETCADLLERHGGHRGAAGFEIRAEHWDEFARRIALGLAATAETPAGAEGDTRRELVLDLAMSARAVDYALYRELAALEPLGPGNPRPVVGVHGLTVTRIRPATGGHAQLTLRREVDVMDGIAFDRGDLVGSVAVGDRVDVAARLASRRFGGYESLQLEVLDVAPARDSARPAMSAIPRSGAAGGLATEARP